MRGPALSSLLIAGLAAATAAIVHHQLGVTAALRAEVGRHRVAPADLARLRETQRTLATARIADTELAALRADHAAVGRLRNEIDATRRRADALARDRSDPPPAAAAHPTLFDRALAANEWTNAGRATPAAAVETALWAAAGGEVDELATTLELAADARERAAAILARLPDSARGQYGTPERLVALLAARDVPLGQAQIVGETVSAVGSNLLVRLHDPAGQSRTLSLSLSTDGDQWRLVVPASAVERYGTALTAPAGGSTP